MAIINQIGGISTGGLTGVLKGPLDKLFGKSTEAYQYKYPMDLGNDPSRMHVVQFTIFNVIPQKFQVAKAVEFANETIEKAKSGDISLNDAGTGAASIIAQTGDTLENLQVALKPQTNKVETTISLYMPDTLSMDYHAGYNQLDLIDATKGFNRLLGAAGSIAKDLATGVAGEGAMNKAQTISDKYSEVAAETVLGLTDRALGTQLTSLGLNALGYAINPQIQLIYTGVGLRNFSMNFIFTPKSKEESDQVSAIINSFIYASSPTVTGVGGMYFTPPSQFEISFHMAKTGSLSGLGALLQKAGNSIIPGVPLGDATGVGGVNAKADNDRLYKVGRCVLNNVSVDYAPNGWAAFDGGAPVQTTLRLEFTEMEILDRSRMAAGEVR